MARQVLVVESAAVAVVVAAIGCSSHGGSLRARSSGDLHCPAESVKIYRLDDSSYRVFGCQQEAVYRTVCDGAGGPATYASRDCTWTLDSLRSDAAVAKQPEQNATAAVAAGCSFDNQCKGDRICVQKQCVAPPASPAPAWSTPSSASSP